MCFAYEFSSPTSHAKAPTRTFPPLFNPAAVPQQLTRRFWQNTSLPVSHCYSSPGSQNTSTPATLLPQPQPHPQTLSPTANQPHPPRLPAPTHLLLAPNQSRWRSGVGSATKSPFGGRGRGGRAGSATCPLLWQTSWHSWWGCSAARTPRRRCREACDGPFRCCRARWRES